MPRLPFLRRQVLFAFAHGNIFSFSRRGARGLSKNFDNLLRRGGRRSAERRIQPLTVPPPSSSRVRGRTEEGARRASGGTRSPLGAPPRLSPEALRPAGSTPGHASWDSDPAGVTRLHLSQSRESTSRTGRSTGVNDARSRPGAGRNAARGDRSRSLSKVPSRKVPPETRINCYVTDTVTDVKSMSL
jgi:hypothetical protein